MTKIADGTTLHGRGQGWSSTRVKNSVRPFLVANQSRERRGHGLGTTQRVRVEGSGAATIESDLGATTEISQVPLSPPSTGLRTAHDSPGPPVGRIEQMREGRAKVERPVSGRP